MMSDHSAGGGFIADTRRQPLPVHERIVRPVSLEQERRDMIITPESLQKDNTSSESERLRGEWEDYRRSGNQKVLIGCSDPRFVLDPLSYTVRSIAAGLDPNSFQTLFNQENVRAIIASTHHDGTTFKLGEHPTGCGGLRAKESEAPVTDDEDEDGLAAFVRKQVVHSDTLIQACATAASIAEVTNKPVLAMTQDHRTGLDIPLAILSDKGHTMH